MSQSIVWKQVLTLNFSNFDDELDPDRTAQPTTGGALQPAEGTPLCPTMARLDYLLPSSSQCDDGAEAPRIAVTHVHDIMSYQLSC